MSESDQPTGQDTNEPVPPPESEMPATEQMEEPSAEKDPDEVPKAPERDEPEPSHEAVGIGIIGRPQTETEVDAETEEDADS